ncbi:hypothetical protein [Candidatus Accumulibacter phosphatis]|uniref:hypothetical protein n=1 Tax=Candidatus Accumulibacter phosphatis TaxID=327160 RepID=UPI003C6C2661
MERDGDHFRAEFDHRQQFGKLTALQEQPLGEDIVPSRIGQQVVELSVVGRAEFFKKIATASLQYSFQVVLPDLARSLKRFFEKIATPVLVIVVPLALVGKRFVRFLNVAESVSGVGRGIAVRVELQGFFCDRPALRLRETYHWPRQVLRNSPSCVLFGLGRLRAGARAAEAGEIAQSGPF